MKIGIISDAHLFHKKAIRPEMYKKILHEDFKNVHSIIDCGDLTDKSSVTADQLDILADIFDGLDKPLYFVAGNHDSIHNASVTNILKLHRNTTIITEPTVLDSMLFVPYMDGTPAQILKRIGSVCKEQVNFAFSHLNISRNIYSQFHTDKEDSKKLNKYAKYWFNGHIHECEEGQPNIFGQVWNIGSCSSLTFGDTHLPNYLIIDIDTDGAISVKYKVIPGSIAHSVVKSDKDVKQLQNTARTYGIKFNVRYDLPNNPESLEKRKSIREALPLLSEEVASVQFSYIKDKSTDNKNKTEEKDTEFTKTPLAQQLIEQFEKDNSVKLHNDIKVDLGVAVQ